MTALIELVRAVGNLPLPALVALVLLTGFGLSAFAIYMVGTIAMTQANGSQQNAGEGMDDTT